VRLRGQNKKRPGDGWGGGEGDRRRPGVCFGRLHPRCQRVGDGSPGSSKGVPAGVVSLLQGSLNGEVRG
jgi:hypothetical protein